MASEGEYLDWITHQRHRIAGILARWAGVNTHSCHLEGLDRCLQLLKADFAHLADEMVETGLPPHRAPGIEGPPRPLGRALRLSRRPQCGRRVLLGIHYDTVYAPGDGFDEVKLDEHLMHGPGVADAKGGIAVMLLALEALERSPWATNLGWDVVLNPDEEIGSPGSAAIFSEVAAGCSLGMIFEPALPDGALVSARRGSGTFGAAMTGRSAHAGRDPHAGRNAIHALAEFIVALQELGRAPGITINVGSIGGGGPVNVVPDLARCRFNARVTTAAEQRQVEHRLEELAASFNSRDGLRLKIEGRFTAPPKPLDLATQKFLSLLAECGQELGTTLAWRPTGGVCDGNRLAAAGLPTVDSLGPIGHDLHSRRERVELDSIVQRARLSALFLIRLASGRIEWPWKEPARAP